MWKKIIIFALAALILAGALGLLWPMFRNIAFEAKLQTIASDWIAEHLTSSLPWYHTDGFGSYYLGSENGYDIFYANLGHEPGSIHIDGSMDATIKDSVKDELEKAAYTTEIAGNVFYPAGADELLVYCKNDPVVLRNNGSHFEKLSSLYEAGEISKSAVDEAAKRFYDYMDIWDTDSDEIKYAYFKYLWYTKWSVDDSSRSESLRREFIRYRDRLEQDGLKIPDWVDE